MKRWCDFIGGKMWLDPEASEFEALMAASKWEHRKVALLQRYLRAGMTFVDAGAHWGYFSLIAAKLGAEVIAFEPCYDNYQMFQKNVMENDYLSIEIVTVALWNRDELLSLYRGYNEATHSLIKNHRNGEMNVSARPFDNFVGLHPDIMKIDVEGADWQVLRGAEIKLDNAESMVILMDLHPELGVDNEEIGLMLQRYGFRLYDIRSDNAPIETIPPTMVELMALKGYGE